MWIILLNHSPHYIYEEGSLIESGTHPLARLPDQNSKSSPVSNPQHQGYRHMPPGLDVYMGTEDLNSGPRICAPNTVCPLSYLPNLSTYFHVATFSRQNEEGSTWIQSIGYAFGGQARKPSHSTGYSIGDREQNLTLGYNLVLVVRERKGLGCNSTSTALLSFGYITSRCFVNFP